MAYPTSSKDASALVKFSQTQGIDLAVRGGGHSIRPTSSTEGGICIDLSQMKAVFVDPVAKEVAVQGGALWSDVYNAIAPHNLAVVGGAITSVGVGGLSLMGGYGWLTGAHGLALDNILSAEIVLASGEIVHASKTENEDLFWAIRGAGACFGIATSFTFRAHIQENLVWNGNLVLPGAALETAIGIANKVLAKENDTGKASLGMLWVSPPGAPAPSIVLMLYYNGTENEGKTFFKPLLDLNPKVNTTKMRPWVDVNVPEPPVNESKVWRKVSAGGSIIGPFDFKFFDSIWDDYVGLLQNVDDAKTTTLMLVVHNPYATLRKGQMDTAFPNRGRHSNFAIAPTWTKEENDGVCREWCLKIREKMRRDRERRVEEDGSMDEITRSAVGEYSHDDGEFGGVNVRSDMLMHRRVWEKGGGGFWGEL